MAIVGAVCSDHMRYSRIGRKTHSFMQVLAVIFSVIFRLARYVRFKIEGFVRDILHFLENTAFGSIHSSKIAKKWQNCVRGVQKSKMAEMP